MTVKQLCADSRMIAGEMNFSDPNDPEVMRLADMSLQMIGKLLKGVDTRIYGQMCVLNTSDVASSSVLVLTGTATYVGTTKTITKTAAFSGANVNANGVIAGILTYTGGTKNFFAYAVSKTDNTLVLDRDISYGLSGTFSDIECIYVSASATANPILTIPNTVIDEIVMVTSSKAGVLVPLDIDEFFTVSSNVNFTNSAAYFHSGSTIQTYCGSGITAGLGVVFIAFRRKPRTVAALTETVDLPIKYHGILRDDLARVLLIRKGKQVPPELNDPLAPLKAQYALNEKAAQNAKMKMHK